MALTQITWANKETLNDQPSIAEKNKVTAGNMNDIKSVVNAACTQVDTNTNEISTNTTDITNLKKSVNYSTTEQVIGTWVDGKPLYRQVLHKTLSGAVNQVVGTINNVDLIMVGGESVIKYDSGGANYFTSQVNSYETSSNWTKVYTLIARSTHTCSVYWNGSEAGEIWVVCYYTKSTD